MRRAACIFGQSTRVGKLEKVLLVLTCAGSLCVLQSRQLSAIFGLQVDPELPEQIAQGGRAVDTID